MIGKVCLALMYGNHLLSFYADYTHYRTSFCRNSECIKYYYLDENSIDQITAKDCVRCNDTYFDRMILPHNFEQSRKTLLKLCSIFFTIESICYLAMAIAFRFQYSRFIKVCLAYLILGVFAFFVTGIASGNLFLASNYFFFNFSNFYLLVRIYLIDGSLSTINDAGWRLRFFKQMKMKMTRIIAR